MAIALDEEPLSEPYSDDELRARRRVGKRLRLARPLVWLLAVVVLLGGIVVLNVTALRQRVAAERLSEELQRARDERETLQAQLAKRRSYARITARGRALQLAEATQQVHVRATGKAKAKTNAKARAKAGAPKRDAVRQGTGVASAK